MFPQAEKRRGCGGARPGGKPGHEQSREAREALCAGVGLAQRAGAPGAHA